MAVSQTNAAVAYIAGHISSFKTVDTAGSWQSCDKNLLVSNITALTNAPSKPSTMYISSWGSGLYKSDDNGDNWTMHSIDGYKVCGGDVSLRGVVIDPDDENIVYIQDGNT